MRHRKVSELMPREVITVPRNAAFKDTVRTLTEHQVSAVPVVDSAGHPLGLISEGDLLQKSAGQGDQGRARQEVGGAHRRGAPRVVRRIIRRRSW